MSTIANSKVAAGRKKLEEYKQKKKPKINEDLNANNNAEIKPQNDFKDSFVPNNVGLNVQTNLDGAEKPLFAIPAQLNEQNNSAHNFFDIISQNTAVNADSAATDAPLAAVLFKDQNGSDGVDNHQLFNKYNQPQAADANNGRPEVKEWSAGGSPANDDSSDEAISTSAVLRLQQQLQFHQQTVEFLVSEKSELSAKINELEAGIQSLKNEKNDLTGRLNISRHRASCLEVEYSNLKEKHNEINEHLAQSLQYNKNFSTAETSYLKQCDDLREELQETKSLINTKISENSELRKKLEELTFHLNASELRLQQLSQGSIANDQNQAQENYDLKQQIESLKNQLANLDSEKNRSNEQYLQYVQQLNNQLETMSHKHEELLSENENLINRESNLIQQMQALEKQLQTTLHVQPEKYELPQNEDSNQSKVLEEQNTKMKAELDERTSAWQGSLAQAEAYRIQIDELNNTIQMMQAERPDIAKLNAANESDRIAAQKATVQNTKMKTELDSLQEAYKKMTDDKLELAELLQAEKNLTRTLTLTLADNEEKLTQVQSKLVAKDEEMIRLQAESSELEKESLKHAQILDRLQHYEAQNQSTDLLQKQLEKAKLLLKNSNDEKERLLSLLSQNNINVEHKSDEPTSDVETVPNGDVKNSDVVDSLIENDFEVKMDHLNIPATEAMKKLQDRFTKLMEDIADLSDDKQRLEHLVIQLQGETDTIGEYIALYQKQRNVLKQREYEKDIQLKVISQERQHMKQQIDQLNRLVEDLVKDHKSDSKTPIDERVKTSEQIIDLLQEIKTNNLIEPGQDADNFHPCPWCSGKLMTV